MTFRNSLLRWLGRGDTPELDPDEYVVVADVELWRSQLVVVALRERDIPAVAVESSLIPHAPMTRARIQVRRQDVLRAQSVLDGLDAS